MKNDFENQIDRMIKKINKAYNLVGWKNHPARNHLGKYLQGEKFDYTIITEKGVFCFDAKQTIQDNWSFKAKDIKQANNLYSAAIGKEFVTSFFLIYFFKISDYRYLDIFDFFKILDTGRKHIKIEDCKQIKLEKVIF